MAFESTSQPRALDALLGLCRAATGEGGTLENVQVYDGPSVAAPDGELLLYLGDPPTTGGAGILGSQESALLGGREREESFTIYCTAFSRSGNTDMKVERDRVYAIMAAVERMLRPSTGDVTLQGTVRWSGVGGRIAYTPRQDTGGSVARLQFEVQCTERLSG